MLKMAGATTKKRLGGTAVQSENRPKTWSSHSDDATTTADVKEVKHQRVAVKVDILFVLFL
jgi:hypothetical protein